MFASLVVFAIVSLFAAVLDMPAHFPMLPMLAMLPVLAMLLSLLSSTPHHAVSAYHSAWLSRFLVVAMQCVFYIL